MRAFKLNLHDLMIHYKFAELEEIAQQLRAQPASNANGFSQPAFYAAISPDAFNYTNWEEAMSEFSYWGKAYPDSYVRREAEATCLISYASEARGGGYANQVTDQGWKDFQIGRAHV